jgi:hypothetical protein
MGELSERGRTRASPERTIRTAWAKEKAGPVTGARLRFRVERFESYGVDAETVAVAVLVVVVVADEHTDSVGSQLGSTIPS